MKSAIAGSTSEARTRFQPSSAWKSTAPYDCAEWSHAQSVDFGLVPFAKTAVALLALAWSETLHAGSFGILNLMVLCWRGMDFQQSGVCGLALMWKKYRDNVADCETALVKIRGFFSLVRIVS